MKLLSKETSLVTISKFLIVASGMVTSIITARSLGPAGRGELILLVSTALLVVNFSFLGLTTSNTYFAVKHKEWMGILLNNSVWISLFGGIIGIGVGLVNGFSGYLLIFMFAQVVSSMLTTFTNNLLIANGQVVKYCIQDIAATVLILLAYSSLAYFSVSSVPVFVGINCGATVLSASLGFYFLRAHWHQLFRFDLSLFQQGFSYALRVYITTLVYFLITRGNVFLLNHFLDTQEVGFYSIASQVIDIFGIFSSSVGILFFPYLLKLEEGQRWAQTRRMLWGMLGLLAICCALMALLIKPVVVLVLGEVFLPSIPLVYASIPIIILIGLNSIVSQKAGTDGYPLYMVWAWIVAFVLWAVLAYLFIPWWGAMGAIAALTISYALIFVLVLNQTEKAS
jgi:enterobacterial common antigen flippase